LISVTEYRGYARYWVAGHHSPITVPNEILLQVTEVTSRALAAPARAVARRGRQAPV